MWIERINKKDKLIQLVIDLKNQVLIVRGARQVGKTSFVLNALESLTGFTIIKLNLSFSHKKKIGSHEYFGRDYFGHKEDAEELLKNLNYTIGPLEKLLKPVIVFVDEADRHPISLETIQTLAHFSDKLKFIFTGSNLENISVKNAATGRKRYFDLYPITFGEFLKATDKTTELKYLESVSLKDPSYSTHYHNSLTDSFEAYLRIGGMPKILDTFISQAFKELPGLMVDLVHTIEENIKSVLGEKSQLYEYEDVLRKLALLSMETLKFSKLQVHHAGRSEVKKIVNKTVGARVAHKIRLFDSGDDLSKYIVCDTGILNYLLNGSDLLQQKIIALHRAIEYESAVGCEIIASLTTRDDLFYWKSKRGAQVEFLLKSPRFAAIDVKSTRGDVKSLNSCAIYEPELDYIIKVSREPHQISKNYIAKIPNQNLSRKIPLIVIPHYLVGRLKELLQ